MKNTLNITSERAKTLKLPYLSKNIAKLVFEAQENKLPYLDFLSDILSREIEERQNRDFERRLSAAKLPPKHDLDEFEYDFSADISKTQMNELRGLSWMEQVYNIILMGPSGTGKTYIASGLVYDAVKSGYKAYLVTMEDIVTCLKMKDVSLKAMSKYRKLIKADLIAIDDIMMLPMNQEEATSFFNLVNTLYEKTPIIITTNKSPTEWAEKFNDEVLTTALLDRLLYRCEVIKLTGSSYRMENRKTIFDSTGQKNQQCNLNKNKK